MARHKKFKPRAFESQKGEGDTSANLYQSMILHPAWMDLTKSQRLLYIACKAEMYAQKSKEKKNYINENSEYSKTIYFTFNKYKWKTKYGLYVSPNQFVKDMNALIEHGFIDCVERGFTTRSKSLYKYSDRWRKWGTEDYSLPHSVMSDALERELEKRKLP